MKILIAEDDRTSRLFLTKYLSSYGECNEASNGMEAVDMALDAIKSGAYYDLICLDIMMPKVDGLKAMKTIRSLEKSNSKLINDSAKIVLISALNDKATVDEAYTLGCNAYVWKPLEIEAFDKILVEFKLIES